MKQRIHATHVYASIGLCCFVFATWSVLQWRAQHLAYQNARAQWQQTSQTVNDILMLKHTDSRIACNSHELMDAIEHAISTHGGAVSIQDAFINPIGDATSPIVGVDMTLHQLGLHQAYAILKTIHQVNPASHVSFIALEADHGTQDSWTLRTTLLHYSSP